MRKKLLTTLALLLMAVSGAWADNLYLEISEDGESATLKYGDYGSYPYYNRSWYDNGYRYLNVDLEVVIYWSYFKEICTTISVDASCSNYRGSFLSNLFQDFKALTTIIGLSNLNTSNVKNMPLMFSGCSSLTTLDLSGWNTSRVTNMQGMFSNCSSLTTLNLSGWKTSNVQNMRNMFTSCSSLTTLDLSGWNTFQNTNIDMYEMFQFCSRLTTLDLSGWNTSNVTNMSEMFSDCMSLATIYVGDNWKTDAVTNSSGMFFNCRSLPNFNSEKLDKTNANTGADGYLNKVKVKANSDGTNYWATYYNSAHSFKADDNTTVYQAKVNGDKDAVVLTEVTSKEIPADNGVVLKSSASSIILSVATTTATYSANDLKGTDVDLATPTNVYCLSNETTRNDELTPRGVGFYLYTPSDGAKIPAHRAYLVVTGVPNTSRGFLGFGDDDGTTAIDNSQFTINNSDGTIYDLSGRIVKGQPRKGIYVKNGKKVVIK